MLTKQSVTKALATELLTFQPQRHHKCSLCQNPYSKGYETPEVQTQLSCGEHFHSECILNYFIQTECFRCPCCDKRLHTVSTSDSDVDSLIERLKANDAPKSEVQAPLDLSTVTITQVLDIALENVTSRFEKEGRGERYTATAKSARAYLLGFAEPFTASQPFATTLPISILEPHVTFMGELFAENARLRKMDYYDDQYEETWKGLIKAIFEVLKEFKKQQESWSETSLIAYLPGAITKVLHAKGHANVDELFYSSSRGTSPIFGASDAAMLLEYVLVVCRDEFELRNGETIKMLPTESAKRPNLLKRISSKFSRSRSREPHD